MNSLKNAVAAAIVLFLSSQTLAISPDKISFDIGMGYGVFNSNFPTIYRVYFGNTYYTLSGPDVVIDNGYIFHSEASYQISNNLALGAGIQYIFAGVNFQYENYQTFQDDYDNRKPDSANTRDLPENIDFLMPYITAKYEFRLFDAVMLSKLSFGYYYLRPNYISPKEKVDAGFALNSEIQYCLKRNLIVGLEISALYGYGNGDNSFPYFDAERYDLTEWPPSGHYESDVYFFYPSLYQKYNNRFISIDSYIKTGIGYGFRYIKISDWSEKYQFNASGIGFYTSLGTSFKVIKNSSANFEIGYRYLKIGDLKHRDERGYFYDQDFSYSLLDFGGPFVQSGFSFSL